ncbi:hypothetical protein F2Q68_00014139 [Brassica cretica]|uniref:Uncharacterized protein n=1 Tax=Brassica cretica TaxID=69181 RepID=A0A8S9HTB0_BRACR|nr:hypothetical protein F2Q68_00014139 [Brassica cretica]
MKLELSHCRLQLGEFLLQLNFEFSSSIRFVNSSILSLKLEQLHGYWIGRLGYLSKTVSLKSIERSESDSLKSTVLRGSLSRKNTKKQIMSTGITFSSRRSFNNQTSVLKQHPAFKSASKINESVIPGERFYRDYND